MLELRYNLCGQVSGEVQLPFTPDLHFKHLPPAPPHPPAPLEVSIQHLEEWSPSLAQVLASHHLFQIPDPLCLPACAWNPLPGPAPLDSDLFNECNILLVELLSLGGHFSAGGCCPSLGLIDKWMKKHMEMGQMEKELKSWAMGFIMSHKVAAFTLSPGFLLRYCWS